MHTSTIVNDTRALILLSVLLQYSLLRVSKTCRLGNL